MARHLSAHGRLIDQFLTACAAVFKGRIHWNQRRDCKVRVHQRLIRRRGTRSKHEAFEKRTLRPAMRHPRPRRGDRDEKWHRGRCCNKEIVTLDSWPFENERDTLCRILHRRAPDIIHRALSFFTRLSLRLGGVLVELRPVSLILLL